MPTYGSLCCKIYIIITGPLTSALCNRFGSRPVAMYGSLITALVLLISTLSHSPAIFLVLFGIVGGEYATPISVSITTIIAYIPYILRVRTPVGYHQSCISLLLLKTHDIYVTLYMYF